jgi:hypothetical protein
MSLSIIRGCVIPAGGSLSNAVDCTGSTRIVRINVPSQFDNAELTFQLSPDGNVFRDLYNVTTPSTGGADAFHCYEAIVRRAYAGSVIAVPLGFGTGVSFLKVRSGTSLVPVVQSQDCEFSFVCELPDPVPAGLRARLGWSGKKGVVRLGPSRDGSTVAIWHGAGTIVTEPLGATGYP